MRPDLQDIHDIFCLSSRKAKTLIPLRGREYYVISTESYKLHECSVMLGQESFSRP